MVGDSDEIAQKHLGKTWEDWVQWDCDYNNRIVKDGSAIIFKTIGDQNEEVIPQKKADLSSYPVTWLFEYAALAQSIENSDNISDLATFVRDLTDDDPRVRRNARDALIALGPTAVAPMLEAWHKAPADTK